MDTKKCNRCLNVLPIDNFYVDRSYSISRCKNCIKEQRKEYYRKNNKLVKERIAKYRKANIDVILEKGRAYSKRPEVKQRKKEYYHKNIEKNRDRDRDRYRKSWIKRRLSQIKSKCAKSNIEFDLNEEWVKDQLNKQNWKCYWSGVPLDVESKLFAPSFDRINAGGSYTKDNVVMACFFVNMGRNNAEYGELMKILQAIKEKNKV